MRASNLLVLMLCLFVVLVSAACDDCPECESADCPFKCPPAKQCPEFDVVTPDATCPLVDTEAPPPCKEIVEQPDEDVIEPVDAGPGLLTVSLISDKTIVSGIAQFSAKVTASAAVMGVEFYVDTTRIDTDLIPPYSTTVNTSQFPDGPHFVQVFTASTDGLTASDSKSITFDNSPPQITKTVPTEGDAVFFEDGPLHMEMEVDDVDAIKNAIFRANGLEVGNFLAPPFFADVNYEDLYMDINSLPKNVYLLFEATDYLQQKSEKTFNIMVHKRHQWTFVTLGEIWASAVRFPDGNIVFGNNNNRIYCLNPSGGKVWEYTADGTIIVQPAMDPGSGRAFFGTTAGTVLAIDSGGSVAWNKDISTPPGGALAYANGQLFVGGYAGKLYSLNPDNGGEQWQVSLPGYVSAGVVVGVDSKAYVGCQDNNLYAISNGSIQWSIPTGGEVWSTAAIGPDQSIYFGSNDGWVYAVTGSGGPKWTEEITGQIWGRLLVASDGNVIVASTSKYVTKLKADDGAVIWSTKTEGISYSSPVEGGDGTLYVGTTAGKIFALNLEDGKIKWTYSVGNSIHATPLLVNNSLYFGSTDRNFYAIYALPPN
ncbi:MAG: PQQ-like beta-propeller repeat protein [Deltaproteobacteria bacterium]|nr:PQQ-like beta-propeller repeat protein [Deltaproteobacteria bacterium]